MTAQEPESIESWILTDREVRCIALFGAILHHGLSNLAGGAVPSKSETILTTARVFEPYIRDGTQPTPSPSSGRKKT